MKTLITLLTALAINLTASGIILSEHNTAVLDQAVSGQTVTELIQDIEGLTAPEVILFLNSPGGSVVAGNNLISYMHGSKKKFTCVAYFAASMAFAIFQACDKRIVLKDSVIMQHEASFGLNPGPLPNQVSMVRLIVNQVMEMSEIQAKRMGMGLKEFLGLIRNDFWIYGKDALKYKAADTVDTVSCTTAMIQNTKTVLVRTFFGRGTELEFSTCPILTNPIEVESESDYAPHTGLTGKAIKTLNRIN